MDGEKRRAHSRGVAGADVKDNMIIDQIMLKFRPIAPRPVTAVRSGSAFATNDGVNNRKRVKRKYVRVKKKKNSNNKAVIDNGNWFDLDGNELIVTDPLQKLSNLISFGSSGSDKNKLMNSFINSVSPEKSSSDLHGVDLVTEIQNRTVVESWITVESVTGACDDQRLLGYTDEEIWKNLESDSCPGFISNSFDEVLWVNSSYRRLLDLESNGRESPSEVAVFLGVKVEKSSLVTYLPAFSCRVRIEYRLAQKKTHMVVPSDVCKMDSGGFAWRLDVKSALSLGPLN